MDERERAAVVSLRPSVRNPANVVASKLAAEIPTLLDGKTFTSAGHIVLFQIHGNPAKASILKTFAKAMYACPMIRNATKPPFETARLCDWEKLQTVALMMEWTNEWKEMVQSVASQFQKTIITPTMIVIASRSQTDLLTQEQWETVRTRVRAILDESAQMNLSFWDLVIRDRLNPSDELVLPLETFWAQSLLPSPTDT